MNIKENISARIEVIHAVNDIKNLKFKYLNACDLKKPNDILECFDSRKVYIDFEDFGIFSSAQGMVEKYKLYSCHPHLIEQHSGKNQIIKLLSNNEASGFWSLSYSLIDTLKNFTLNITGTYEDLYVLDDNKNWLIKKTIFKKRSSLYKSLSTEHCSNSRIARSLNAKETV
ncbi:nuclear transport factor 2 family protein [Gammaproteobacteria bacterium]|nr:nuclear transport factor 2 family protein [Gammaproteobacteria bacterium]MDB2678036.1 nuclear transport factor 2 family protein [Gammaproteobacteria bacterium]